MSDMTMMKDKTMDRVAATLAAFLFAAFLLALFDASDLVSWSYDLPINRLTEALVIIIEKWAGWMEETGLLAISETIADWMQWLQELSF
ncbi:hypothetical protein [Cohaesibacter celericrescens]|uniref:Uncharacterized protein n=1 Tax=Cohaesibacter celericrescens TaxID=2067669 RepID=A0A2N5XQ86_9HYPH|nr:hypothetical protein [Cohaesibacter celericrescens]PLW76653.1 hypothetical protein C0081_11295 [Cohaesibacter celericrescens]